MKVTALHIYPIKSLGGISLESAEITPIGFTYDRYWMLVDEHGKAITQRDYPILALFQLKLSEDFVHIKFKDQELKIPKVIETSEEEIECTVWGKSVIANKELFQKSDWFSDLLKAKVQLVRKSKQPKRLVKDHPDAFVNFPDSNQYLILGEESLANLNAKLSSPVPMNRFRPNIVFSGGTAHLEDQWTNIQVGESVFEVTKACARCNLTTINQETAEVGIEPLRTLAQYRRFDRKILFGQYLKVLKKGDGIIKLGDAVYGD
ncbi:MAG: MOSC N-terminal beta barrel domain-containing protein [Bacteroidota bacterium]